MAKSKDLKTKALSLVGVGLFCAGNGAPQNAGFLAQNLEQFRQKV